MTSPTIFWWLPNLYPYPRTLSYLTDIFLTTYLTFLSRCLTGDSNQYIKIRIHHFPSYHPYSLLSLVLANNTSNHLDTQTINPRVSLWLFYLSHLPHPGSHVLLSCVPSCPSHHHCLHAGFTMSTRLPKSQRAMPLPLLIPALQNLMTHLSTLSFPFHFFELSRLPAWPTFRASLFIISATLLTLTWYLYLSSIFLEGLEWYLPCFPSTHPAVTPHSHLPRRPDFQDSPPALCALLPAYTPSLALRHLKDQVQILGPIR